MKACSKVKACEVESGPGSIKPGAKRLIPGLFWRIEDKLEWQSEEERQNRRNFISSKQARWTGWLARTIVEVSKLVNF